MELAKLDFAVRHSRADFNTYAKLMEMSLCQMHKVTKPQEQRGSRLSKLSIL